MGESKRRKERLGDLYGTPEHSRPRKRRSKAADRKAFTHAAAVAVVERVMKLGRPIDEPEPEETPTP